MSEKRSRAPRHVVHVPATIGLGEGDVRHAITHDGSLTGLQLLVPGGLEPGQKGDDRCGEVRLETQWAILAASDGLPLARGRSQLRRPAAGAGSPATVAAMNWLVGGLCERIAKELRELPILVEDDSPEEGS